MSDEEKPVSESDQEIFSFDNEEKELMESNDREQPVPSLASLDIRPENQRINIKDFTTSEDLTRKKVGLEDFEILSVIGKGAYGQVFLVQKNETEKIYAMKVLRKASIVLHGKNAEHTKNERSILEEISHPFIVKLHYAFQCPSRLYLILSYCSGGELFSYLSQERMFSENTTRFYIAELLLALEHLHSLGIIYR
jgi:serine/threonine protein kinase